MDVKLLIQKYQTVAHFNLLYWCNTISVCFLLHLQVILQGVTFYCISLFCAFFLLKVVKNSLKLTAVSATKMPWEWIYGCDKFVSTCFWEIVSWWRFHLLLRVPGDWQYKEREMKCVLLGKHSAWTQKHCVYCLMNYSTLWNLIFSMYEEIWKHTVLRLTA